MIGSIALALRSQILDLSKSKENVKKNQKYEIHIFRLDYFFLMLLMYEIMNIEHNSDSRIIFERGVFIKRNLFKKSYLEEKGLLKDEAQGQVVGVHSIIT